MIYDLAIVGGGSAGLSAGIYSGRAKMNVIIIEKAEWGGQVNTTAEILNYPGVLDTTGPHLMELMRKQAESFGVEFTSREVTGYELLEDVKQIATDKGTIEARSVIIAQGASPRKLNFEGESEYIGRGIAYCATCDGELFTGKEVFVIGGGFAAAEESVFLTRFATKVTVIVREADFTCAKTVADKAKKAENVDIKFNTEVVKIWGDGTLKGAKFRNNITGEEWEYNAPEGDSFGMFIFAGSEPATSMVKDEVELDQYGYIITDDNMKTKIDGVYAAGDLRHKNLRQIVTAVADGAIAATECEKYVAHEKDRLGIKEEYVQKAPPKQVKHEEVKVSKGNRFITAEVAAQLNGVFARLTKNVKFVTVVDPTNDRSQELQKLLEELTVLSNKLALDVVQKGENPELEQKLSIDKFPVVCMLDENDNYTGVKFCGVPGGHELNSFVLTIYNLGSDGQAISPDDVEKIKAISKPVNVKVVVSLACHLCPDVVVAGQRVAILNENVETEMIDIALFEDIKKKYNIMSVPAIIIDNEKVAFGAKKLSQIIELINQ
ncbi:MAG: thioredoxin reductase [Epulopiscium sp. Nele67-Bin005]|nr:MAG: thioredoxin reductase [Epulopiscium sp. Nele67-Bin005]